MKIWITTPRLFDSLCLKGLYEKDLLSSLFEGKEHPNFSANSSSDRTMAEKVCFGLSYLYQPEDISTACLINPYRTDKFYIWLE